LLNILINKINYRIYFHAIIFLHKSKQQKCIKKIMFDASIG